MELNAADTHRRGEAQDQSPAVAKTAFHKAVWNNSLSLL